MKTTLVVATALFAAACGTVDLTHDSSPLRFSIREGYILDPPPPPTQIGLLVETTTQYPCLGYRLESEFHVSGSTLRVSVSDRVTKPSEVCLTAIGPAGFRVLLPTAIGTYTLEFTRDGVTDRYTVTITDAAIEIAPIEMHFTTPTALTFPRGG
ncbi:MAG TPA: hypothetical protein VK467_03535 [Gemmatimonadales bacterium]|jgi:hypothetical protein|nr:hypothetical protein [Gemmatimonadales bacterium]